LSWEEARLVKIVVCMKQVPSSEARITIAGDGLSIERDDLEMVVNPYDEYALEEALRIKEAKGEGEVVVLTLGPEKSKEAIRSCLAMGADRGVIIQEEAYQGGDGLAVGRALADVIQGIAPDLVLCGKLSIDVEHDSTAIAVAEYLGWPHVSLIHQLEWSADGRGRATRDIEGGQEIIDFSLPAVLTAEKGLNEPRYAPLKGIMAAKRKPIEEVTPSMGAEEVGAAASGIKILKMDPPPQRAGGKRLEGEPGDVANQLADLLKNEAKII
jgi:electron transfer flavoprotein beta subunit